MEFRSENLCVCDGDAHDHQRAGIAQDGGSDIGTELLGVLICQREMRRKFSGLGEERREGVGREALKLVDMNEERHPAFGRQVATTHGDELQM